MTKTNQPNIVTFPTYGEARAYAAAVRLLADTNPERGLRVAGPWESGSPLSKWAWAVQVAWDGQPF